MPKKKKKSHADIGRRGPTFHEELKMGLVKLDTTKTDSTGTNWDRLKNAVPDSVTRAEFEKRLEQEIYKKTGKKRSKKS